MDFTFLELATVIAACRLLTIKCNEKSVSLHARQEDQNIPIGGSHSQTLRQHAGPAPVKVESPNEAYTEPLPN
jgi:hypothetical protein